VVDKNGEVISDDKGDIFSEIERIQNSFY